MGLNSIAVTFKNKNHNTEEFKKNQYDILGFYLGSKDEFVFILDESMNFITLVADDVLIKFNATCYGWENDHTRESIKKHNRLNKYFDSFHLLRDIMTFDIDKENNVNVDYVKSHIESGKKVFRELMDANV